MLKISDSKNNDIDAVAVSGKLNIDTCADFESKILKKLKGQNDFYIDFTDLSYISSVGIRSLVIINKKAKADNTNVHIIGASGEVKEVIQITGISAIIKCHDSFDSIA